MRKEIKVKRELDKVKERLAKLGIELNVDVSEETEIEADAVLLYYEFAGKHFVEKSCKECGRTFATTNPRIVGRCSNQCRADGLRAIGIEWSPYKTTQERWGSQYPLTLSPEALNVVKAAVANATP